VRKPKVLAAARSGQGRGRPGCAVEAALIVAQAVVEYVQSEAVSLLPADPSQVDQAGRGQAEFAGDQHRTVCKSVATKALRQG